MLIDDDIRQIEQEQEANVAVLKTPTERRNEQNQGQHFTFGRPKSKRIFESDSRVTTLLSDDSASE